LFTGCVRFAIVTYVRCAVGTDGKKGPRSAPPVKEAYPQVTLAFPRNGKPRVTVGRKAGGLSRTRVRLGSRRECVRMVNWTRLLDHKVRGARAGP